MKFERYFSKCDLQGSEPHILAKLPFTNCPNAKGNTVRSMLEPIVSAGVREEGGEVEWL